MKNIIKTLLLPAIILLTPNYSYSIDNNQVPVNSSTVGAQVNSNPIQNVINNNNTEYMNLFNNNNINYYNQVSKRCIQEIKNIKPEYTKDIKEFSNLFNYLHKTLNGEIADDDQFDENFNYINSISETFLNSTPIPLHDVKKFAKIFDKFPIFHEENNTRLSNNNLANINKYIANNNSGNTIIIKQFYQYIKSQILKLRAQTLKGIKNAIENDNNELNNIIDSYTKLKNRLSESGNNDHKAINKIIKVSIANSKYSTIINKSAEVLHDIITNIDEMLVNLDKVPVNIMLITGKSNHSKSKEISKSIEYNRINVEKMKQYLYEFDKINYYYYGSKLQKRFDALHNKVISACKEFCNSANIVNNHPQSIQDFLNTIATLEHNKEITDNTIMNQVTKNHKYENDIFKSRSVILKHLVKLVNDLKKELWNNHDYLNGHSLRLMRKFSDIVNLFIYFYQIVIQEIHFLLSD